MRKHWEVSLREASASMPDIDWNQTEEAMPAATADLEKN
jgi:predicted proteasome-type protease